MRGYLEQAEGFLERGAAGVSALFAERQVESVASHQLADGGFRGRQGGSDPYYTEFALRTLVLLAPGHPALSRAALYLESLGTEPRSVLECFSLLNGARLAGLDPVRVAQGWGNTLRDQLAGALARRPPSPYEVFLAALCLEILGETMPALNDAARAVSDLSTPDGGFAGPGRGAGQTNLTAAAASVLYLCKRLEAAEAEAVCRFLSSMQARDGGLRAHAEAASGDLLSTFTGTLTLFWLQRLHCLDLAALARFLRACASPQGGFVAMPGDAMPDPEYTYYGVGTMCLLRAFAQVGRGL